ncbi:hypothetical protein GIB67_007387 [Kingdonia uniflora]|uniref:F-box/LRR-repeat protein 15/At3g58940/PEG3-like LRR domain-containing protein n=1 Tax=Kingdonia uniflora TaxID=39325 RepID=A0A7J7NCQ6_9MAGN|nr:hypothetical protein GIB67_007387 [Kingdonia uniflora]
MEVFSDYISNLPDNVIERILLGLPMKDGARTSILSTTWKYKWAAVPQLEFDYSIKEIPGNYSTVNVIDHVLLLHIGPIHKFKLSHHYGSNMPSFRDMDRWIFFLSRYKIKEFILDSFHDDQYILPSQLFSWKDLHSLTLDNCAVELPPMFKGFPNLRTLHLESTTITDDAFERLIPSCPLLDTLRLTFFDCSSLRINAPNLRSFSFDCGNFDDVNFIDTLLLSTVFIYLGSPINGDKSGRLADFIGSLPRIKKLSMDLNLLQYLARDIVPGSLPVESVSLKFLYMEINFRSPKEILAALCVLGCAPKLHTLNLDTMVPNSAQASESVEEPRIDLFQGLDHLSSTFSHLEHVWIREVSDTDMLIAEYGGRWQFHENYDVVEEEEEEIEERKDVRFKKLKVKTSPLRSKFRGRKLVERAPNYDEEEEDYDCNDEEDKDFTLDSIGFEEEEEEVHMKRKVIRSKDLKIIRSKDSEVKRGSLGRKKVRSRHVDKRISDSDGEEDYDFEDEDEDDEDEEFMIGAVMCLGVTAGSCFLSVLQCRTLIFVGENSPFHSDAIHMTMKLDKRMRVDWL